MKTKISVAICTYNGEQFIKEQINSILNQTLKVNEIVICDDCSTDNTIKILNDYKINYPEIFTIIKNEIQLGSTKNFEKALKLCQGDIIFLSDQDDVWLDIKVFSYIKYFNENPKINVLASNGYCIDQNSVVQEKYAIWDFQNFFNIDNIPFNYNEIITCISNIATGATMAIRKSFLSDIFPFPILKNFHHDEWIAILSSSKQTFYLLDKKYFYYRIHNNQAVGGIFHDRSEKAKKSIIETFNIKSENISFKGYKKLFKRLSSSRNKYLQLELNSSENNKILMQNSLQIIERIKKDLKLKMKNDFALKYRFQAILDLILNKKRF